MLGWLIYRRDDASKNQEFIRYFHEESKRLHIDLQLKYVEDLTIGIQNKHLMIQWKGVSITLPDFVIQRSREPMLSYQFEQMGIRVFNSAKVSAICNDKGMTYQFLSSLAVPMIPSLFCKNQDSKAVLMRHVLEQKLSRVVKAVDGHGGSQVYLLERESDIPNIMVGLGNSDCIIQPLTGIPRKDMRVYVLGNQVLCSIVRTGQNNSGFRANFSLGGTATLRDLTEYERKTVEQIIRVLPIDLGGIDFLFAEDGSLILNEIEDVVGTRMVYQCTDINIVRQYLIYIEAIMNSTKKKGIV